ncbi:Calmodulin-binding transcription activator [Melia azedarach]|uniref:Calmodulin-binding transcription activator n=1 Tax=Melia azedarach TaxID=155640 RepID=A0ACC1YEX8_MELAZ|nr:Calmodulin-binding transcription activator [Melia azedarach]
MAEKLVRSEIHGFRTLKDLDVDNMMEEAKSRWLRPNEIHAILCNSKYFNINAKPVNLPKSGTVVLFDRKTLRNFRKDGHNWKKKKDGKTVKEAHEHLKVGNEERIHVYYAHGEDSPTFVRRCYWLLDKTLENIVLVHYRETQEGSPVTPPNSLSSSVSDQSTPLLLSEEFDSGAGQALCAGKKGLQEPNDSLTVRNHEMRLHEINTLEWDELVVANDPSGSTAPREDKVSYFDQQNQTAISGVVNDSSLPPYDLYTEVSSVFNMSQPIAKSDNAQFNNLDGVYGQLMGSQLNESIQKKESVVVSGDTLDILAGEGLQSQDSFGRWMNYIMTDSPGPVLDSSISSGHQQYTVPEHVFSITDVSPAWAFSAEKTKVLVTGFFREDSLHLVKSNMFCVCGDVCVPVELVQVGVYRCWLPPHSPGSVHLYLSLDGHKPISEILNFEYRAPQLQESTVSSEDKFKWEELQVQMRLSYLLFSTFRGLNILSSKVPSNALKEAKKFAQRTSHISNSWAYLVKLIGNNRTLFPEAKESLFELTLKNKLKEWLLERVVEGCKTTEYDVHGQGVIHLCAILGYTWAVYLFSWSGLSLDFRDKYGWTALHWAAFYGREKMVAVLLSAGAKPNLVTDPTSENPGGCTAADLAYKKGYDGLAAFLSEQALVAQFNDMNMAGNISGSLQTSSSDTVDTQNLTEDEVYLKDTLTAYRTAAEAAARIQAAFREHSLKVQAKAVQFSNPEDEAQNIIAAMKIQHAFRNYETRRKIAAAARIQHRFRSWKVRKEFLNMRRQAIKIQAAFRGFQVRKQYRKILWSVGVLEKAILRWRLKRKGFRGLQVDPIAVEAVADQKQESDAEEDFYRTSRKQAEERIERSVVRVQAMFRSKKAQEEYRRMKLAHNQAKLEYEGLIDPDAYMDG